MGFPFHPRYWEEKTTIVQRDKYVHETLKLHGKKREKH